MNSGPDDDLPTQIDTLVHDPDGGIGQAGLPVTERDLGPFRILRKLGEGGMGQVYLAKQLHPVERHVAIKLILRKVQDARSMARFEIEQQALAQMSHPAIAQVFDAGTTPAGYPFFAMEFVDGEPLGHYCQRHRLDLSKRLKLMMRICLGVQHAHQRGIIHRDLKPGNILVATVDGVPRPKIIDFGIARATEKQSPDAAARDVVGTPQYMSPEQFNLDEIVLDPRSDVYSLGVILHELLVGCPPIEGDRLSRVDSEALSQVFAEHDPLQAPSTRIGKDSATDRELAEQRQTRIRKLRQRLRNDLDAITLKALAQSRDDRYSSPKDLADDIERALGHYPVSAVPDSPSYRMRRFIQRNKLAVGSASAIVLALVAGLTAATLAMLEAQRQFQIAEQRQSELEQVSGFQQAMLENLDPQSMGLSMMGSLRKQYAASLAPGQRDADMAAFEALLQPINATDIARNVVDEQLLEQARESIVQQFSDQPLLRADLLESIASVYLSIGRPSSGQDLRKQVLELRQNELAADHIDVLTARVDYGYALFDNNQLDDAEQTLQELIEDIEPGEIDALSVLLRARNGLALVMVDQGRIEDALALVETAPAYAQIVHDADPALEIDSISKRGYVLARAGQIEKALGAFEQGLALSQELSGPTGGSTLNAMMNVSAALGALGRNAEALDIETDLLERLDATVGREHVMSIRIMGNMANNLRRVGREDEALERLKQARATSVALMGPLNPVTFRIRLNLGSLMTHLGQLEAGYEILDSLVRDRASVLGPDHPETLTAMEVRVSNLQRQERYDKALESIDQVIDGRIAAFGPDHRLVADSRWLKALILRDSGQVDEALTELLPQAERSFEQAPRDSRTLSRAVDLYHALVLAGESAAATAWRERALAWLIDTDPGTLDRRQQDIRNRLLEIIRR